MIKSILLAMGLAASVNASALTMNEVVSVANQAIFSGTVEAQGFDFKVGDKADYKLNMGGFIQGTMAMEVKAVAADEVTLAQSVAIMGQNQNCEMVLNPNTGETKSLVCEGKAQEIPDQSGMEVVDMKEDKITVPAGTFECLYIKVKQTKDNSIVEQWANPKLIPVTGMIKSIMPSQLGKVTVELTAFKKN